MTPRKMINKKAFEELKELNDLCESKIDSNYTYSPCLTLGGDNKELACVIVTDNENVVVSIINGKNIKDLTQKFEAFLEGLELNRE